MRWPGQIPAGVSSAAPLMTIDLLPTIAQRLGAQPGGRKRRLPTGVPVVREHPDASVGDRDERLVVGVHDVRVHGIDERRKRRLLPGWEVTERRSRPGQGQRAGQPAGPPRRVRRSLVQALADQIRLFPNAQLSLGCGVSSTLTGRDGRVVGVRLHDGQELVADLVVACDGRGSALRRSAGLELSEQQRPIDVLWFQLPEPASHPLIATLAGRFHNVLAEGRSLAIYPSARGGVQLGLPLQPGERQHRSSEAWLALWRRLCPEPLDSALQELPPEAIEGPQRLPVRAGLAERWWRPGLLLLGDAAHPMSPVRAQGTSMGLRDAVVAAGHLASALDNGSSGAQAQSIDHALAAISWRRRGEIARIQALQRQEWQRGERLAHNRLLRRMLADAPPWFRDQLAQQWRRSQMPLRHGQAGALSQGVQICDRHDGIPTPRR
jgi:2-polyprenyl-6-methoxyphenol hydroxylase-like FAD-dependent oxidoreductase